MFRVRNTCSARATWSLRKGACLLRSGCVARAHVRPYAPRDAPAQIAKFCAPRLDWAAMIGRTIWVVFLLAVAPAGAAEKMSDDQIRRELIGSWIVPFDSTDRSPQTDYTMETFRSDGTYVFYAFQDAACRIVLHQAEVKWLVENGVLVSILPDGSRLRDEVVNIDNGRMTLHSLDDLTTYTRAKALTCSKFLTS